MCRWVGVNNYFINYQGNFNIVNLISGRLKIPRIRLARRAEEEKEGSEVEKERQ